MPAPETSAGALHGEIQLTEPMGNEIILYLKLYDYDLTARCSPDIQLNANNLFHFSLDMEKIHFFDAETEERIQIL